MDILITGGSGFLGKHLIAALINSGDVVTVIGRGEIKGPIRWIEHDLLQEPSEDIKKQLMDIDVVIHLAAVMPAKIAEGKEEKNIIIQNKIITKNVLSLVDSPKRFIFASSVDVYPYLDTIVDENTPLNPVSVYGQSKKGSEAECLQWSTQNPETKLLMLRFSHLYGPADTNNKMIDTLVRNAVLGKKSTIYGDGSDKRTYLFVEDAVKAIQLCLRTTEPGIFNVGGSRAYSIREVIDEIQDLGLKMQTVNVAGKINSGSSIISSTKAAAKICFISTVDLQQGLCRLMPKNIFIDLDGPILDVKERYYFVYKQFVTENRGTPLPLENYWEQKRLKISMEKLLQMSNCPGLVAEHKKYLSLHREESSALALDKLQPKTKEILAHLSKSYNLYLITLRRNKENLICQLEELGILAYFKEVLTTAPTTEDKWNHKVELLKEHHLDTEAGLILGDTPTEILAAKKTGLTSIAVANGIRTEDILLQAGPHLLIQSIEDIAALPFYSNPPSDC